MTGNRQYSDPDARLVRGDYAHSGAPGSTPSRAQPPDDYEAPPGDSGIPGVGTPMDLSYQMGPGEGVSTSQPGQVDGSPISPGSPDDYGSSGAGDGHAIVDGSYRYPWQQKPGGW